MILVSLIYMMNNSIIPLIKRFWYELVPHLLILLSCIGPRPSELYGKFTWRIDNFSQINKRELRSNSFDVGGFKWYGLCMGMNWTHYFLFILYSTAYIFLLCCIFASYLPARYDLAVSFQWFWNAFYYVQKVLTQMNLLKQHKVHYLHVLFELQILNGGHSKGDLRVEKRL